MAQGLTAQTSETNYEAFALKALERSEAYRRCARPDSSLFVTTVALHKLDSLGLRLTTAYNKLELEQGIAYADKERYLLALRSVTRVVEASAKLRDEHLGADAALRLAELHLRLRNSSESKALLASSQTVVKKSRYEDLQPMVSLLQARWHQNFGYSDSVQYHLDAFFSLPDLPDHQRANALMVRARQPVVDHGRELNARKALLEEAISIYRQYPNFRAISDALLHVSRLTIRVKGQHRNAISYADSALHYCRLAEERGQRIGNIPGIALQVKGKAYEVLGVPDSAFLNVQAGYAQQMAYWRNNSAYKRAEATQIHRNEQRDRRLRDQEQQLRIQGNRNLGLIAFASLILLFSLSIVFLYGRLKKAKELTERQAVSLEQSNQELAEAKNGLEESLRLQVMLKAELQHRVKNNLQLILSLLNRHHRTIEDPELKSIFQERKEQIQSIALVHQKIAPLESAPEVDPEDYLGELMANIERSYAGILPGVKISLSLAVDLLHVDAAVPLGLILNELVTNAYKYAFPDGGAGNIDVTFAKFHDHFHLRVSDDGAGLPEDVEFRRSKSTGTRLIKGLVRQLDGSVKWTPARPGTVVDIKFRAYLGDEEV